MGGKEIELKDRISDVTEMIPRRLLRAALGRRVLKIWFLFSGDLKEVRPFRRSGRSGEGGCTLSSL